MNEINQVTVTDTSPSNAAVEIALIAAASTNNVIGKDNHLVWNLPNDLKFFKNTTWGFPVIMGRKTFAEVNKPLPGRTNIVITRQQDWSAEGTITALSVDDAVEKVKATNSRQLFIIGGGEVYKQSMAIANTIYLTRVHGIFDGDAFFPDIDEGQWNLVSNEDFPVDDKHAYAYSFQVWRKRE